MISKEAEYYNVEKILDKKRIKGKIKYLIKWKGFSMDECTWEPISNLENIKPMLNEFNLNFNNKKNCIETDCKDKSFEQNIENNDENNENNEKIEKKELLNQKRKNSESSLKSTEDDIEDLKEDFIFSEPFIKSKELNEKIISINKENGELTALVERKDEKGKIKKEKIKTKDLKKTNPWILINYYEYNILFCYKD